MKIVRKAVHYIFLCLGVTLTFLSLFLLIALYYLGGLEIYFEEFNLIIGCVLEGIIGLISLIMSSFTK